MMLVIYKENNGAIYLAEELSSRIENADSALADFNARYAGKSSAELVEAPEGLPLEWLYKNKRLKIKDFRDELIGIQGTLDDLYGRLNWVEERLKEDENSHAGK